MPQQARMRNQRRPGNLRYDPSKFNFNEYHEKHYGEALRRAQVRRRRAQDAANSGYQRAESGNAVLGLALAATLFVLHYLRTK